MLKNVLTTLAFALVATSLTGCATSKRVLTSTLWNDGDTVEGSKKKDSHYVYLSYWEGSCRHKYFGGCSAGDSHVKFCSAQDDNSLKCEVVEELDKLLVH